MKKLLSLILVACPLILWGQASRVDINLLTSGSVAPGTNGLAQALWVSNSSAYLCTHPSATLAACQSSLVTTYTDSTAGTPCPPATQLVQLPGSTCTSSTSVTANIGAWVKIVPFDYWVVSSYGTRGPFTFFPPANGCPTTGCTYTGLISTAASSGTGAGLNIPAGTAPSSPNNGDCWTTTAGLYCQINGATVGPYAAIAPPSPSLIYYVDSILGSDANSGTSFGSAFKTIAHLTSVDAAAPATTWYLVRSSSADYPLTITAYSVVAAQPYNIVTLTYTGTQPTAGQVGMISGLSGATYLNNQQVSILPGSLTASHFEVSCPYLAVCSVIGTTSDSGQFRIGRQWHETLSVPRNGMTIGAVGTGAVLTTTPQPLLDSSDVIPSGSWSLSGGGCYQATVSLNGGVATSNTSVSLYENGLVLARAVNLGACQSTAGTMYVSSDTNGSITIYAHPWGGGNPSSNGFLYEYTSRLMGLDAISSSQTGITVQGIWTRRNLHQTGSLQVGNSCSITGVLATDGSKHNLLYGENCTVTDSITHNEYFGNNGGQGANPFIGSTQTGTGGSIYLQRDIAIQDANIPAFPGGGVAVPGGFFAHASGGQDFSSVTYDTCQSWGMPAGSFDGVANKVYYINSSGDGQIGANASQYIEVNNTSIVTSSARAIGGSTPNVLITNNSDLTTTATTGGPIAAYLPGANLNIVIDHSKISAPFGTAVYTGANPVSSFISNWNTFLAGSLSAQQTAISVSLPAYFKSNNNTYYGGPLMQIGASSYSFANYLIAYPAQDTTSSYWWGQNQSPIAYTSPSLGGASLDACLVTQACGCANVFSTGTIVNTTSGISTMNPLSSPGDFYLYTTVGGPGTLIYNICNRQGYAATPTATTYTVYVTQTGKP